MKFTIPLLTGKTIEIEGEDMRDALQKAVTSSADFSSADLLSADLGSADLRFANLKGAFLPAPTAVLLANWNDVSDELCVECMAFDAHNHPTPAKFNAWAKDGNCPYSDEKIQRCIGFAENPSLWTPDLLDRQPLSAFELMKRLIREKCKDSDYH